MNAQNINDSAVNQGVLNSSPELTPAIDASTPDSFPISILTPPIISDTVPATVDVSDEPITPPKDDTKPIVAEMSPDLRVPEKTVEIAQITPILPPPTPTKVIAPALKIAPPISPTLWLNQQFSPVLNINVNEKEATRFQRFIEDLFKESHRDTQSFLAIDCVGEFPALTPYADSVFSIEAFREHHPLFVTWENKFPESFRHYDVSLPPQVLTPDSWAQLSNDDFLHTLAQTIMTLENVFLHSKSSDYETCLKMFDTVEFHLAKRYKKIDVSLLPVWIYAEIVFPMYATIRKDMSLKMLLFYKQLCLKRCPPDGKYENQYERERYANLDYIGAQKLLFRYASAPEAQRVRYSAGLELYYARLRANDYLGALVTLHCTTVVSGNTFLPDWMQSLFVKLFGRARGTELYETYVIHAYHQAKEHSTQGLALEHAYFRVMANVYRRQNRPSEAIKYLQKLDPLATTPEIQSEIRELKRKL